MTVNELKKAIFMSNDKKLIKYIVKNFTTAGLSEHEIKNNMETLNELDLKTRQYGIARMKKLEWSMDSIKTAAPMMSAMLAFAAAYVLFSQNYTGELLGALLSAIIGFFVLGAVTYGLTSG